MNVASKLKESKNYYYYYYFQFPFNGYFPTIIPQLTAP